VRGAPARVTNILWEGVRTHLCPADEMEGGPRGGVGRRPREQEQRGYRGPVTLAPPPPTDHAALFARLSASRPPQHALAAFAGGALPHTLLAACGSALLAFFSTRDVLPLRAACSEARGAVARHPWEDADTAICGSAGAWHASFPNARVANASGLAHPGAHPLAPRELAAYFGGLRQLHLHGASAGALAAARAALPGARVLGDFAPARLCWGAQHCEGSGGDGGAARYGVVTALAALDSGLLVSGGRDLVGQRLWGGGGGEALGALGSALSGAAAAAAALPGARLALVERGHFGARAAVWRARAGSGGDWQRTPLDESGGSAQASRVLCLAALPGGRCATGSEDKVVRLYDARSGALLGALRGHGHHVRALAALGEGGLASGSEDGSARLWSVRSLACTAVLAQGCPVSALAALEGGGVASAGDGAEGVWLWRAGAGAGGRASAPAAVLRPPPGGGSFSGVACLAALPWGLLASGCRDCSVRVWSVAARACVARWAALEASVQCLTVLRGAGGGAGAGGGERALPVRLATGGGGEGGVIRVWALACQEEAAVLAGE
jgi:WD40 repeat protein